MRYLLCLLLLCGQAFATDCGFKVHKGGISQSGFTVGNYSLVTYPYETPDPAYNTEGQDVGSRFNNSTWTPVPIGGTARYVAFSGQIWITNGATASGQGPYYVARIVKNGYPAGISIGAAIATKGPFADDWVINLSMMSYAQPGDTYIVVLFTSNAGILVNGVSLHTWWDGVCL